MPRKGKVKFSLMQKHIRARAATFSQNPEVRARARAELKRTTEMLKRSSKAKILRPGDF